MRKHRNKTISNIENHIDNQSRILNKHDFLLLLNNPNRLQEERHKFIAEYDDRIDKNYSSALSKAEQLVTDKLSIPMTRLNNITTRNSKDFYNSLAQQMGLQDTEAFTMANRMYEMDLAQQRFNSCYNDLTQLTRNTNDSYNTYINPYEAQLLFETTSLGYSGVVLPIQEAFSTTLSIHNPFLEIEDVEGISKFLIEKDIVNVIKMAIIDAFVYGGGVVTPVFIDKFGNKQFFKDLQSIEQIYHQGWKLWDNMIFDRYCTIPYLQNDGFYFNVLRTYHPKIPLLTIFGNSNEDLLSYEWSARFSPLTTSLCRTIRPDGFGSSIFTRAGQAVYNYTTQLKFLQYALSQLSIIVFNTENNDYERGGADYHWNSSLGGNNIQQIQQQLSQMQQGMNVEQGIFLNGIQATTLNRTFTGIDSIINAVKAQASNAFNVRQELLFGDQKSNIGNTAGINDTPKQLYLREHFRHAIVKIVQWCVLGYFAEHNYYSNIRDNKGTKKVTLEQLKLILTNTSLVYNDSVKNNADILRDYGSDIIYKLVESRLISINDAARYISTIPVLSKVYSTETQSYQDFITKVMKIQDTGFDAELSELEFMTKVNKDALENNTKILQKDINSIDNNFVFSNNLGNLVHRDANGKPKPLRRIEEDITTQEPTQQFRKRRSKE